MTIPLSTRRAKAQGIQLLQIGPFILVLSVWFVPDLAENLISLQLLDQAGYSITILSKYGNVTRPTRNGIDALTSDLYQAHISRKSMIDSPRALRLDNTVHYGCGIID